jgi:hypothetical protein
MQDGIRKIEFDITASGRGSKIRVDGKEIPYVRKVEVIAEAGEATIVRIEMFALDDIKVEGQASPDVVLLDARASAIAEGLEAAWGVGPRNPGTSKPNSLRHWGH